MKQENGRGTDKHMAAGALQTFLLGSLKLTARFIPLNNIGT